jgi:hypothetical protein
MNTAKLLNRAPTLIMVACLAYACYKIQTILPGAAAGTSELAKGLDVLVKDVLHAGAEEAHTLTRDALRDPFRIRAKKADAAKTVDVATADPESDPLAGFVHSLSLDATFLQGKTQIAIINGRMYHKGQHLIFLDDGAKVPSPLFVENVQFHRVTLRAHNTNYELGYPDSLGDRPGAARPASGSPKDGSIAEIDPEGELAFYKKLANGPLGKLGKGLTGISGPGGPTSGAGKSRRSRGARGAAGGGGP